MIEEAEWKVKVSLEATVQDICDKIRLKLAEKYIFVKLYESSGSKSKFAIFHDES